MGHSVTIQTLVIVDQNKCLKIMPTLSYLFYLESKTKFNSAGFSEFKRKFQMGIQEERHELLVSINYGKITGYLW